MIFDISDLVSVVDALTNAGWNFEVQMLRCRGGGLLDKVRVTYEEAAQAAVDIGLAGGCSAIGYRGWVRRGVCPLCLDSHVTVTSDEGVGSCKC